MRRQQTGSRCVHRTSGEWPPNPGTTHDVGRPGFLCMCVCACLRAEFAEIYDCLLWKNSVWVLCCGEDNRGRACGCFLVPVCVGHALLVRVVGQGELRGGTGCERCHVYSRSPACLQPVRCHTPIQRLVRCAAWPREGALICHAHMHTQRVSTHSSCLCPGCWRDPRSCINNPLHRVKFKMIVSNPQPRCQRELSQ